MSVRLFQGIVYQMREVIDRTIGVIDESLNVIACSDLGRIGQPVEGLSSESFAAAGAFEVGGITYRAFGAEPHKNYLLFVEGADEEASRYAALLAISLTNIKQYYDEKYDRGNFIKNILLDNILPGDIYLKAHELRFNSEATRVVMLIRVQNHSDISTYDVIQNLFPERNKDFVISINETDIVLVKEIRPDTESKDLEKLARSIVDTLGSEFYTYAYIGIGMTVESI